MFPQISAPPCLCTPLRIPYADPFITGKVTHICLKGEHTMSEEGEYEGYLDNIVRLLSEILERLKKIETAINRLPKELENRR